MVPYVPRTQGMVPCVVHAILSLLEGLAWQCPRPPKRDFRVLTPLFPRNAARSKQRTTPNLGGRQEADLQMEYTIAGNETKIELNPPPLLVDKTKIESTINGR